MKEETELPEAVAQLYWEVQGHDHFRGEVTSIKYSKDSIMGFHQDEEQGQGNSLRRGQLKREIPCLIPAAQQKFGSLWVRKL